MMTSPAAPVIAFAQDNRGIPRGEMEAGGPSKPKRRLVMRVRDSGARRRLLTIRRIRDVGMYSHLRSSSKASGWLGRASGVQPYVRPLQA
jgi:hypothetical protein